MQSANQSNPTNMETTQPTFVRFNRYETLSMELLDRITDFVVATDDLYHGMNEDYYNEVFSSAHRRLRNSLYGIYDGYRYNDLQALADEAHLPGQLKDRLAQLLREIDFNIDMNS